MSAVNSSKWYPYDDPNADTFSDFGDEEISSCGTYLSVKQHDPLSFCKTKLRAWFHFTSSLACLIWFTLSKNKNK